MNMRAKRSVKPMRGFMCQPQSSTALCMAGDGRSVIVPRRTLVEHDTLVKAVKYSRLTGPAKKTSTLKPPSNLNQDYKKPPPVLQNSSSPVFQVVVMRVSIHCEGCAGKVKKHLSKMAGVTSFSIDLEDKRVTVMGHVSPVGVLESISKVKKAELWTCDSNEESQDEEFLRINFGRESSENSPQNKLNSPYFYNGSCKD